MIFKATTSDKNPSAQVSRVLPWSCQKFHWNASSENETKYFLLRKRQAVFDNNSNNNKLKIYNTNLFPRSALHLLLDDVLGQRTSAVVLRRLPLDLGSIFVVVHHFRTTWFTRRICAVQTRKLSDVSSELYLATDNQSPCFSTFKNSEFSHSNFIHYRFMKSFICHKKQNINNTIAITQSSITASTTTVLLEITITVLKIANISRRVNAPSYQYGRLKTWGICRVYMYSQIFEWGSYCASADRNCHFSARNTNDKRRTVDMMVD